MQERLISVIPSHFFIILSKMWIAYFSFLTILWTVLCSTATGSLGPLSSQQFQGPGPNVHQTWGEPWPIPQKLEYHGQAFMVVRPAQFTFRVTGTPCDMVDEALKRYYGHLMQEEERAVRYEDPFDEQLEQNNDQYRGHLDVLDIALLSVCEDFPHDRMDESYKLQIDTPRKPKHGSLVANSNWGILRGLETFLQIVHHSPNSSSLRVRSVNIHDFPRFTFRSVLLDTSRHFLSKKVILQNLDIMAMNKMNVFHWHIVDDQSFPFQSRWFPELSDKGAYHRYGHVYTPNDVDEIIEYARVRGIRVVPEFDTPGHTQSWGPAVKDLLTACYKNSSGVPKPDGTFGPIDPTNRNNYNFLKRFFSEVAERFPDAYLHLGGDEVDEVCWESNPQISSFMLSHNISDYSQLEAFYMKKLLEIVADLPENKTAIVWQEVFDNGVNLPKTTLVNVWKGGHQEELSNVTGAGYRAILYAGWYMDWISYGVDWPKYYVNEPHNFTSTLEQKSLVMGGGAAMWTEYCDSTNLIQRLWPRAAATAERLWSSKKVNDVNKAKPRMEEHRCRLLRRGFPVQPSNGPGYCLFT